MTHWKPDLLSAAATHQPCARERAHSQPLAMHLQTTHTHKNSLIIRLCLTENQHTVSCAANTYLLDTIPGVSQVFHKAICSK